MLSIPSATIVFILLIAFVVASSSNIELPPDNLNAALRQLYFNHQSYARIQSGSHHARSVYHPHAASRRFENEVEVAVDVMLSDMNYMDSVLQALRQLNCTIIAENTWHMNGGIAAHVPLHSVLDVAKLEGVLSVTSAPEPTINVLSNPAVDTLRAANLVRNLKGEGITIGVLSDSFDTLNMSNQNNAAMDILQGFLPGPGNPRGYTDKIYVLQDSSYRGTDEGRAMLQLIHSLAPKARLCFSTAIPTPLFFANAILALADAPCSADIIVDDILYSNEPIFSPGIIGAAVERAIARGVVYVTAAGNNNGESVVAPAHLTNSSIPVSVTGLPYATPCKQWQKWSNGDFLLPLKPDSNAQQAQVSLQLHWDAPYQSSTYDYPQYNLFLLKTSLQTNVASYVALGNDVTHLIRQPLQSIDLAAGALRTDAFKYSVAVCWTGFGKPATTLVVYNPQHGYKVIVNENPTSTVRGHGLAKGALMVGAVSCVSGAIQPFSSSGPSLIAFGAGSNGERLNGGACSEQRLRPSLTGCDGIMTSFFGAERMFYGTSAAAPNVAALMALVMQKAGGRGSKKPDEIINLFKGTASGQGTYDRIFGYGVVNVDMAAAAIGSALEKGMPPSRPTNIQTYNLSPTSVGLSWSAACDGGSNITAYALRLRQQDSSLVYDYTVGGASLTTTTTITSLTYGVTYSVSLRAQNRYGFSVQSDPVYFVAGSSLRVRNFESQESGILGEKAVPIVAGSIAGGVLFCVAVAVAILTVLSRRKRRLEMELAAQLPPPLEIAVSVQDNPVRVDEDHQIRAGDELS
mmetsp:Transcript_38806/g.62837  ORF Transcript_38806/g.62837 Transcript_38806/m.62837 type:complete len:801 (+) Transcript_38806:362-2764(+)